MWENTDQKNSEYGHFSRNVVNDFQLLFSKEGLIKDIGLGSKHARATHKSVMNIVGGNIKKALTRLL